MGEASARRAWTRRIGVGAVVVAAAVCANASLAVGTSQPSPASLLNTALQNATARGSVHEAESDVFDFMGMHKLSLIDDVATNRGRQDITHYGGQHAHVIVVDGTAYFSGNQAALAHYFGLGTKTAKEVGSRWVVVPSSSKAYAAVSGDATLPSALTEFKLTGRLTETPPTKFDAEAVTGIRGSVHEPSLVSASETVYVSLGPTPLPVGVSDKFISKSHGELSGTITLTDWGEPVTVAAPTNVVSVPGVS